MYVCVLMCYTVMLYVGSVQFNPTKTRENLAGEICVQTCALEVTNLDQPEMWRSWLTWLTIPRWQHIITGDCD